MKRILLDTNALVSFLTDRDPDQQQQVADLFDEADRGQVALALHQVVLTEMVYVLANLYRVDPEEVRDVLQDLLLVPGILLYHDLPWQDLLSRWPDPCRSLADACLVTVALREKVDAVGTFDRKLIRHLRREGLECVW